MNFPKLKYSRFCRILTYVVVLGGFFLPLGAAVTFPLPDVVKIVVTVGSMLGLLWYLIRNFVVLMTLDIALAMLSCYRTARIQYTLPAGRTADVIRKNILSYGMGCEPTALQPQPSALRYRFSASMTEYSSGIERVIAAYEVDYLDRERYRQIFSSAKTNSEALIGRKKAGLLDKNQKKQPLHRVTVVPILAHRVDPKLIPDLYELVNKQNGDEMENCIIPCVINLEAGICVFNCVRIPYVGYGYAAKNRGIRIIKNRIFGGNLNLQDNCHRVPMKDEVDLEQSLWDFWAKLRREMGNTRQQEKQMVAEMTHQEIRVVKNELYLKWGEQCICQYVQSDAETKTVKVDSVTMWTYPKTQPIDKKTIREMEARIVSWYQSQGYRVEFINWEEA